MFVRMSEHCSVFRCGHLKLLIFYVIFRTLTLTKKSIQVEHGYSLGQLLLLTSTSQGRGLPTLSSDMLDVSSFVFSHEELLGFSTIL